MKTMLDKCAVAGDITQAIDRRGAWSCAVTVIGGTENTAVKLQSADSAGGEFTDFKTLISADEAEADQYKGFVLDLSGAGNFIKIVGATMATCVLGDCDHDVKTVAIKAGEIPSGADLEDNKTATINVSTYTEPVEVTPTEGKDGMAKATVTLTNIPSPSGNLESDKRVSLDIWDITGSTVEITPSQSYNGMEKVTVDLGLHAGLGQDFALCNDDNGHGEQVLIERPPTVGKKAWNVHDGDLYTITGVEDVYFTTDGGEGVYTYPPNN